MDTCDVLIVGGGPAGSTCAWKLREAGLDVVVVDRALFPRDKVCAGWITPRVVADLQLDVNDYESGRTFQAITAFRTGIIGGEHTVETRYDRPVSFAIRRYEFDDYLLRRSAARLMLDEPITSLHRNGGMWAVNERVRAPIVVGAGGHFCPVARWLNGGDRAVEGAPVVVAQEAEWRLDDVDFRRSDASAERAELFFCADLKGYGWCVPKGQYVNVGLGRLDRHSLPSATAEFLSFLTARGTIGRFGGHWCGHAYALRAARHRRVVGDGMMLVGDAAGVAEPHSGEGIHPAIQSALVAASTVLKARGCYDSARLQPYADELFAGTSGGRARHLWSAVSGSVPGVAFGRALLDVPPFVRRVVLDRWFLGRARPASAKQAPSRR